MSLPFGAGDPLITAEGRLLGVLDLDSPSLGRFSDEDARGLGDAMRILLANTNWPEKF